MLEDCHQSCREHAYAGAESSIVLPLGEWVLAHLAMKYTSTKSNLG